MFEDLKNEQNNKVDDIFEESDKADNLNNSQSSASANQQFSEKGPVLRPKPQSSASDFEGFEDSGSRSGKILKTLFLIIIVLAIIGIGAYFVYSRILVPKTLNIVPIIEQEKEDLGNDSLIIEFNENELLEENVIEELEGETLNEEDVAMELLKNIDSDSDGLSDYDEIYIYGADPNNPDTDGDGLSDYQEVMIFGTDPLNPDTDGDGYLDGQEVMSGYNPLGEGKLDSSLFKDPELFAELFPSLINQ